MGADMVEQIASTTNSANMLRFEAAWIFSAKREHGRLLSSAHSVSNKKDDASAESKEAASLSAKLATARWEKWTDKEVAVLTELVEQFPERDASGMKVKSNPRYSSIRKELKRRVPGCSHGKTAIRDQAKLLKTKTKTTSAKTAKKATTTSVPATRKSRKQELAEIMAASMARKQLRPSPQRRPQYHRVLLSRGTQHILGMDKQGFEFGFSYDHTSVDADTGKVRQLIPDLIAKGLLVFNYRNEMLRCKRISLPLSICYTLPFFWISQVCVYFEHSVDLDAAVKWAKVKKLEERAKHNAERCPHPNCVKRWKVSARRGSILNLAASNHQEVTRRGSMIFNSLPGSTRWKCDYCALDFESYDLAEGHELKEHLNDIRYDLAVRIQTRVRMRLSGVRMNKVRAAGGLEELEDTELGDEMAAAREKYNVANLKSEGAVATRKSRSLSTAHKGSPHPVMRVNPLTIRSAEAKVAKVPRPGTRAGKTPGKTPRKTSEMDSPWSTADEELVIELVGLFPERDPDTGKRMKASDRYAAMQGAFVARTGPGGRNPGKAELQRQVNTLIESRRILLPKKKAKKDKA